jgi:hypothetical protein
MRIFDYVLKDSEKLAEVINLSPQSFVSVYSSNSTHVLLKFNDIDELVRFIKEKCNYGFPGGVDISDKNLFYDNVEKLWTGKTFYELNDKLCLQLATTVL